MSIRHKPLVALGAGALAMMALVAHLIWSGYHEAIQSAEARTGDYAGMLEARLDAMLRRADADLQKLALTIPLAALSTNAVSGYAGEWDAKLDMYLLNFPELTAMRITDVNGQVIYTSKSPPSARVQLAQRDYFRTLRDNPQAELVFSEVILSNFDRRHRLIAARALRDDLGVFRGMVFAAIELAHLQKLFQTLDVGAEGVVSVYRSDNFTQVLRWPQVKGTLNVALPLDNPTRAAFVGSNRTATRSFTARDGSVRIYSSHALHPYPFFTSVGVARGEVLAAWRARSLAVGLSALLLLGLLLGLLYRLGRTEAARTQLAAIVADADVSIYSRTLEGTIQTWNAGAKKMLGYSAAEVIGKSVYFTLPPGRPRNMARVNEGLLRGEMMQFESDRLTQDGRVIDVMTSHSPIRDGAGNIVGVSVILQDITERKIQEQRITRLSRINAVLSGINAVIVRVRDRQELFNEACRIAVEHGHFGIAWIGRFDPATQDLTAVAWAGESADEVTSIKRSARDDTVRGKGAVGRAIRERRPVFTSDLTTHGFGGPRLKEVLRLGFRSHIVLPLFEEQTLVGTLAMYARERNFFDKEELKLLSELAGNVSFAIEHITGQQKLEKLSRIRALSSEINALIVRVREPQTLFAEACRIAVEHGGFGIAWIGMVDQKTLEIIPVASAGIEAESLAATNRNTARPDMPQGQTIVGRAIREKRLIFSNDLAAETSQGGPRRQEAIRRGYCSLISLPLLVEDKAVGSLSLFAREPDFFDDEEIVVLAELAGNISFAQDLIQKSEALADNEKKLDNILSTLQEVVWSIDPHSGRIVYVNAAVRQLTRRPVNDFLAQPRLWRRMVHRDDRASMRSGIRRLLKEGTLTHEFRIVLADGEERTVKSSARVRHDDEGEAVYIDGTVIDITERVRAEELQRKHYMLAQLQTALAKVANQAVTPEAALQTSLRLIIEHGGWLLGHLTTYTLNNGHHRGATSLWQVEDRARFAALIELPNDFPDSTHKQFRHKALVEKLPVWLEDLGAVSLGRRTSIARALGLRRAFAFPLIVQNETAAILEFYAEDVRAADTLLIENIGQIAAQLARVIERARANEVQARLAGIVENSNDAIIGRSLDGIITSWNAGAERLYGYTAAETVGRPRLRLSPPELLHETDQSRALLTQGLTLPPYKTVRVAKNGRRINVQVTLSPIRDGSGNVVGTSSISHDISENVRAEDLQRKHYELVRLNAALAAAANEAVTVEAAFQSSLRLISEHGSWQVGHMVNFAPATANLFKIGASVWQVEDRARFAEFIETSERFDYTLGKRLVGRAIGEKIPVWIEDIAVFEAGRRFGTAVAAGLRCAFAFPVVVQNEAAAVLEFYSEDVRPADSLLLENIVNVAAQLARVIERARASEGQTRLAAIVESSQDAIVSSTADSTVLTWNAGAERMFGYASEEVIGRKLLSLIVPDDLRQDIQQRRQSHLSGARLEPYESERLTKDQRRVAVSVTASALKDESSQIIGIATIYRDISDRRQAEQSMRAHAMQLRQLSRRLFEVEERERRRLARELHDRIGQNVTALSLNLNMVRGELSGEYRQKIESYLDDCEALLDSTAQLIRDVMAELRPPGLDELGLLAALTEHARHLAGLSGFSVTVRGAGEMPRLRPATEITLFRIAQEALINVAKHARASAAAIALEADTERVILTVSDNGSGFDPAARFSEAIPHLGMASMRERAEAIGGRLRVESAPGRGTRVIAEAPRTAWPQPALSTAAPV